MRASTALRLSGASWFVPLVFAVGVYIALSDTSSSTGYPVNDLAVASRQVAFTGPLIAAFTALRFRGFSLLLVDARPVLGGLRVLFRAWSWILLGAPVAGILGMLSVTQLLPRSGAEWSVLAVILAAETACGAVGLMVARCVRPVLGVPLVAAGTFAWLALPGAGPDVLARNLNSAFVGCCTPEEQPARAMIAGSLALDLVIVVAAAVSFLPSDWARQAKGRMLLGLVGALVVALASGAAVARQVGGPLDLLAVEPRTTPLHCQTSGAQTGCVWPENRARAGEVVAALQRLDQGLSEQGLPTVRRASELPRDHHTIEVTASEAALTKDVAFSMAVGYVHRATTCAGTRPPRDAMLAVAFIAALEGLDDPDLTTRGISPTQLQHVHAVLHSDQASARGWFSRQTCPGTSGTAR